MQLLEVSEAISKCFIAALLSPDGADTSPILSELLLFCCAAQDDDDDAEEEDAATPSPTLPEADASLQSPPSLSNSRSGPTLLETEEDMDAPGDRIAILRQVRASA